MPDHVRDEDAVRRMEVLAAGVALRAAARLGTGVTAPVLDRLLLVLARSHPRAFATLAEMPEARVLLDPVDQPVAFLLTVGPTVRLRIADRAAAESTIHLRLDESSQTNPT